MLDLRVFALICVMLGGMGQGVVSPQLPNILKSSHQLALDSGISATLMYLGIFISTFRYGKWADQGRVHWLLGPGLFFYAITLIVLGFATTTPVIFLTRFLEGLCLSAVYVAADFILGRLSSAPERGRWLSYYGVALSIGLLLGPAAALGGAHLTQVTGWGVSFNTPIMALATVAALALVLGLLSFQWRVPEIQEAFTAKSKLNPRALAAGGAYGYLEAALVAVFPVLAVQEFKVIPEYCLIAVIIAAALSSLGWGYASDKAGPRKIVKLLLTLLVLGPAAMILVAHGLGTTLTAFISCILFGFLAGGLYPVSFAWLLESLPESQYGYASGSFARIYGLGSLIGPLAVGEAVQQWGAAGLFAAVSLAGAAVAVFVLSKN